MPGDRLELNAKLASSLSSPVLLALDVRRGQDAAAVARSATIAKNTAAEEGAEVLGLVVNQVHSCLDNLNDSWTPFYH